MFFDGCYSCWVVVKSEVGIVILLSGKEWNT